MNLSEGGRRQLVDELAAAAGRSLLDVHSDRDHNRSVLTLAGPSVEESARALTAAAVTRLDLRSHTGAHPRLGVVDVVPFVPLEGSTLADAVGARDSFAAWAAEELGLPCFLYGPERSLPDVRRLAFSGLAPDRGPGRPHPTAGAVAVGARPPLVAYNLWLVDSGEAAEREARRLARELRGPAVRALAFRLGGSLQLSFNLIDPLAVGPAEVYDSVSRSAAVARAELVGLVPRAVLGRIDPARWAALDLSEERTIEARVEALGG